MSPRVLFGHSRRLEDGTIVPNGVAPEIWRRLTEAERAEPIPGADFQATRLPHYLVRSGYAVVCDVADRFVGGLVPWFYPLCPYAVPEMAGALAGLPAAVRRQVELGHCYVLIDYSHEGFSEWMFFRAYEALRAVALPARQVVLLSGDLRAHEVHRRYVAANDIHDPVCVHPLNYFKELVAEHMASPSWKANHVTWDQAVETRTRPRVFLNFNRRNRLHRILATVRLQQRGLLCQGLVSLPESFEGRSNEEVFEDEAIRFGVSASLLGRLRSGYPALRPMLPLSVDVKEMVTNHAHTHPTGPYLQTWMSLVSETLFFESAVGQVFVSEKVFKPMMNLHPFLLIGDAHTLEALRRMGFRTFHPYIDEAYDAELNHERRLEMILSELERLAGMSEGQRYDWLLRLEDVLRHNFGHLSADRPNPQFRPLMDYFGKP